MKYLKLFEKDEDAIYNRTSDTLYDAPGVAYIKDVDKVIYAPFDLNQKYYIDENYNAVLYRDAYIDIVNNSETINITDISSPIVKTIDFTFENITTNNIEIVLSGTSNVTSSEIILDGNSCSFDITYTPVDYGTESVQIYLRSYNINNTEELVSSNIVTFNYIVEGQVIPDKVSIEILNKEELETPITVQSNTIQPFTINVDLQQLTLENCSVTSSNNKFTIGSKENNSIVVNFKSTTSGTFTSTITISDNTYNTGKSDSVVLTINVPKPKKSYYLRYSYSSNDDYNSWTNQIEGTELSNGDISFGPVPCIQHGNYVALTTKANDTSLSGNINISSFTGSHDGSLYSLTLQEKNGKYEYRVETKNAGDYTIIFNLTNKTIYVEVYSPDEPVDPDEPTEPDEPTNPDEPADPDEPTEPTEDTNIKVASYNIRYYNGSDDSGNTDFRAWPYRKAKVFEMIRKHDMDVCGLQEVTPQMQPDIDNTLTEYEYIGYGRDSGLQNSGWNTDEQTGLIYKKSKFNKLDQGKFFLSSTPDKVSMVSGSMFNRLATWVKLQDKETLKEFIFASTHFDHPTNSAVADSVREQQAQYAVSNILSIAGNLPIFFVGDFNSESNTTAYSVLTSTFNDSYNFLTEPEGGYVCNLDQINSGKCPGCSEIGNTYTGLYSSSDIDPKRIDYVFYLSDKSSISSYLVDTDNLGLEYYPSDHLPVVCDMVIQ